MPQYTEILGAWFGNIGEACIVSGAPYLTVDTTAAILDAANEHIQLAGQIQITGRATGVTVDSSSKIIWRSGTSITWDPETVLTIGLQDVAVTGPPMVGDGTYDVYGTVTGAGAVANSTTYATQMTTGSKVLSHNDLVAIKFELTTVAGSPQTSLKVQARNYSLSPRLNMVATLNGVSGSRVMHPLVIDFEGDGSVLGAFDIGWPQVETFPTAITYGSGTEHGMWIRPSINIKVDAFRFAYRISASTVNTDVVLYTTPGGTPSGTTLGTIDGNNVVQTGANLIAQFNFSPVELLAGTDYVFALKPSGSSGLVFPVGFYDARHVQHFSGFGTSDLRCSRTGGGAFSTTANEQMYWSLRASHIDVGAPRANYLLGVN